MSSEYPDENEQDLQGTRSLPLSARALGKNPTTSAETRVANERPTVGRPAPHPFTAEVSSPTPSRDRPVANETSAAGKLGPNLFVAAASGSSSASAINGGFPPPIPTGNHQEDAKRDPSPVVPSQLNGVDPDLHEVPAPKPARGAVGGGVFEAEKAQESQPAKQVELLATEEGSPGEQEVELDTQQVGTKPSDPEYSGKAKSVLPVVVPDVPEHTDSDLTDTDVLEDEKLEFIPRRSRRLTGKEKLKVVEVPITSGKGSKRKSRGKRKNATKTPKVVEEDDTDVDIPPLDTDCSDVRWYSPGKVWKLTDYSGDSIIVQPSFHVSFISIDADTPMLKMMYRRNTSSPKLTEYFYVAIG